MKKIKFGTDGWRGIMADDFTFDNVRRVSRAVARYLRHHELEDRGVVIGYDNRFLSDRFARLVEEEMLALGVKVLTIEEACPTPAVAFAIRHYRAGGAVMITASHNPPEYNGIKFIPEYAGPAVPEITAEIENLIESETGEEITKTKNDILHRGERQVIEVRRPYVEHLKQLIDADALAAAGLKVVIDPMHGAGRGYLEEVLSGYGVKVEVIRGNRDPLFGGILPEPTVRSLGPLAQRVIESGAHLGLALDGDADRFGIIDRDGTYISANQFLPLLYYHLLAVRKQQGPVVRTVATTHMLDRLASAYGQQVYETPVGFKYIGQHLLLSGCVLGGEESGGLSIAGHVPEKDGILAGLLAAEMVARHGCALKELLAQIHQQYGRLVSRRVDIHTDQPTKERVLQQLAVYEPSELAGREVSERRTADGVKLLLADGCWVLVRASGTEPLFRIYAEAEKEEDIESLVAAVRADLNL